MFVRNRAERGGRGKLTAEHTADDQTFALEPLFIPKLALVTIGAYIVSTKSLALLTTDVLAAARGDDRGRRFARPFFFEPSRFGTDYLSFLS